MTEETRRIIDRLASAAFHAEARHMEALAKRVDELEGPEPDSPVVSAFKQDMQQLARHLDEPQPDEAGRVFVVPDEKPAKSRKRRVKS